MFYSKFYSWLISLLRFIDNIRRPYTVLPKMKDQKENTIRLENFGEMNINQASCVKALKMLQ